MENAPEGACTPTCRYGHGPLTRMPQMLALPMLPPWAVTPVGTELFDAPLRHETNPPHLRLAVHYCETCSYMELHYE